jgi:hypothetical protein
MLALTAPWEALRAGTVPPQTLTGQKNQKMLTGER